MDECLLVAVQNERSGYLRGAYKTHFTYEIKGTLLGVCVRTQIIFWIAETFRPIAVFPDVQKFLTTFIASVERNV